MPSLRLSEIADFVGGVLVGDQDPLIEGVSGIAEANSGDLTFVTNSKFLAKLQDCKATAVIVGPDDVTDLPAIRVAAPYPAFALVLSRFLTAEDRVFPVGIHATSVIDPLARVADKVAIGPYCVIGPDAEIGEGTRLGSHVVVGPDVKIGKDCRLYARVALREGCQVGNRVILHIGCSIGTDGFGYLPSPKGLQKIPQVGIVALEDDVEIGAGVCIDRATTGITRIGAGSKIDNLVQIGHNVVVGSNCAVSAQCGLSGSSVLGDRVTLAGQVGISHQVEVGSDVKIGGQSGVTRNLPSKANYFGLPAIEAREAFKISGALRRLPKLLRRVTRLESELKNSDQEQE